MKRETGNRCIKTLAWGMVIGILGLVIFGVANILPGLLVMK